MKNKEIYIMLTGTSSVLSRIIKFYTKKPYNHASIAFDPELKEVYSFGRKRMANPFLGGFVKEDVTQGLFKNATCIIYSLRITEEQYESIKQLINDFERHKDDYRYHFIGLIGFLINKPIKRKKAFFCSQFVATTLKESQVTNFDKPLQLVSPFDLQEIEMLDVIYEGDLQSYLKQSERWYDRTSVTA